MHYRGYRDKTDTAQLRVRGRVVWGTSICARKKVISLAEGSQRKNTWVLIKEAFLEEAAFKLYSEG